MIKDRVIPINKPKVPDLKCMLEEYQEVFDNGMLTNHKYVGMFEERLKEYLRAENVVGVSCCTSGLMLVAKCLGLTGEVIVPSFTFPATVHSLIWNNLTPVFVDCDPETFNLDVDEVEKKITKKTSAILGVYIFGNPPEMDKLENLASKYQLKLIFDSAHALGSHFKGKFAGNFGDAEVFSLAPTKIITSGEGGIITTKDNALAEKLRLARNYGNPGDYDCSLLGLNARMNELSAILGLKSMNLLEGSIAKREVLVDLYKKELSKIEGIDFQKIKDGNRTTFNYFAILIDPRKFCMDNKKLHLSLKEKEIMTRIYFYPPVHRQKVYKKYYYRYKNSLPCTDKIADSILCLPLYSDMGEERVLRVCKTIRDLGGVTKAE